MRESGQTEASGPISSLLGSLTKVLTTVVGIAQTRLEILSSELQQEVALAVQVLVWAFVAMSATAMGLFLGALVLIFAFWDTHRILVAVLVLTFFLLLAVVAVMVLRSKLRARGRLFEATIAEFAKDRAQLDSRS